MMRSSSSSRSPKVGMLTFDWKSKLCSWSSWFRWHIFLIRLRLECNLSRFSGCFRKITPKTPRPIRKMIKTNPVFEDETLGVGNSFSNGLVWCCSEANEGHTWYDVHLKMKWQGKFSGNAASNSILTWRMLGSQTNL